jgi:hypothetical protein
MAGRSLCGRDHVASPQISHEAREKQRDIAQNRAALEYALGWGLRFWEL